MERAGLGQSGQEPGAGAAGTQSVYSQMQRSRPSGCAFYMVPPGHNRHAHGRSAQEHGAIWKKTLDTIAADGLLKQILYVDLCNEFPLDIWAPFLPKGTLRASPFGTTGWATRLLCSALRTRICLTRSR